MARSPFAALGSQHHWTTPEEVGERQPLAELAGQCRLSFDGRLDNRGDLWRELGRHGAPDATYSDARLVSLAWERWGSDCFRRLLGPFAVVVYDPLRHRLVCARDPLGSRTLFYAFDGRRFVAASEERAVVAHPAVDEGLDERRLAWHLALRVPGDGSTFFRAVRELTPGELLVMDEEGMRSELFRAPRPEPGLERLADADCAERFREVLEESVAARLRAVGTPSVLMSGGLDSTSIAALASRRAAAVGTAPPTPVSWLFDELTECDERRFIAPVCRSLDLEPVLLPGDGGWPLGGSGWAANPNTPEENPYRRLKSLAYEAAAGIGGRVLLTGGFGDHLWAGAAWWLAGLLRAGRPLAAAGELARELRSHRSRALGGLRRALRLPPLRRPASPGWLSPVARRLAEVDPAVGRGTNPRMGERTASLLGPHGPRSATIEIFHAARAGVELRHPFRDLRVVEFALGLPAHQLYRRRLKKHLLRQAMRGLLPEVVLTRRRPTGLDTLYRRGIEERERGRIEALLATEPAAGRMLRRGWLDEALGRSRSAGEELALWHLIAAELWHRRHRGAGLESLRRTA